jgi:hypothetical protein
MRALEPLGAPGATPVRAATPYGLLVLLAGAWAALAAGGAAGWVPAPLVGAMGVTAAHGALLATALGWSGAPPAAARVLALALAAGALAAALHPLGALGWLAPPAALGLLARRGALGTLADPRPVAWRALGAGALLGAGLGAHLLVSASLTLGRRARPWDAAEAVPWLGYDLGANALAAECFFRGALFPALWRRVSLARAATAATAAYVARYLVDPLLPKSLEMLAGAVFYLAVLGGATCWLRARTGQLLPGYAAALVFFVAYRRLGPA